MRSVDCGLGLPYDIGLYAILTHLVAKITNTVADELIFCGADTHIYNNHVYQIKEQITRIPYKFPYLKINKDIYCLNDIENMSSSDFTIENYEFHPPIKMIMAV